MPPDKPQIKLVRTKFDIFLERAALSILILLWIYTIFSYSSLPAIIPAHYDYDGKVDRYDSKALVFLLPGILTIIFVLLTVLSRHPVKLNYMQTITKENAEQQYRISTRLLRVINLVIAIAFSYIVVKEIHDSQYTDASLDWWFLPALILGLILPTIYYILKGFKVK